MKADLEQDYFHWLCEQVGAEQGAHSYWLLLGRLHALIFTPMIEHDENRESDGIELRDEFLREHGYPKYAELGEGCSFLEMMVALSERIEFETDTMYIEDRRGRMQAYWFWEMIDNLGLDEMDDGAYWTYGGDAHVDDIVETVVEREYDFDGRGGLFPLKYAVDDQRDVEIWYQMAAYLNEKE